MYYILSKLMIVFLLFHIGVPLLIGVALVFFVAAASRDPISWDTCNDIALDFAILSMGANGGIFLNPKLIQQWGDKTAVYGIGIVAANLVFAGILVYRRRWQATPVPWPQGIFDLVLGGLAIGFTCGAFIAGHGP